MYINFGLWALALLPGWLVIKEIGVSFGDNKLQREGYLNRETEAVKAAEKAVQKAESKV